MHLIGQPLPKQKRNLRELYDDPRTPSFGRLPCPEGFWKWEHSQEVIPEVSSLLPPQGFLDGGQLRPCSWQTAWYSRSPLISTSFSWG